MILSNPGGLNRRKAYQMYKDEISQMNQDSNESPKTGIMEQKSRGLILKEQMQQNQWNMYRIKDDWLMALTTLMFKPHR